MFIGEYLDVPLYERMRVMMAVNAFTGQKSVPFLCCVIVAIFWPFL